jgi:uncharacterized protein
VILLDANLLVYANDESAPEHEIARPWFDSRLNGPARVGLPWASLFAFVRLVSNPAIVRNPVAPAVAWERAREWLALETVWIPEPGPAHGDLLTTLLARRWMTSRLVPDAHLAALALEHGLVLCSSDGDFARFPNLRWENPLATAG